MEVRQLTATERGLWASFAQNHHEGSLWQSPAWEAFQQALGRHTRVYAALEDGQIKVAALVIIDKTTGGFSSWDIPRGPVWDMGYETWAMGLLETIRNEATKERCLCIYLSPFAQLTAHSSQLTASSRHEQPEATRILDLTLPEDALLAQMHPKGRYNIKVAQKHGVTVAQSTDVAAFHRLMAQTGERDAFGILSVGHYRAFLNELAGAFLLLAFEGMSNEQIAMSNAPDTPQTPIAGLLGVVTGGRGIYYYGASNYAHRASMAPYLLQWEAMRHCRSQGCTSYDLLGIAPEDAGDDHPWSGVSRFKAQFGGMVVSYPHEQCLVLRPMLQHLLNLKRRFF